MLTYKKGDILTTTANFIMIPVNIEGTFTNKIFEIYPQLHKQYTSICKSSAALISEYNGSLNMLLGNILPYTTKDKKHILLCFCNAEDKYFGWAFNCCFSKIVGFLRVSNIDSIAGYNNELVSSSLTTIDPECGNCWEYYYQNYFSPRHYFNFDIITPDILLEVWND